MKKYLIASALALSLSLGGCASLSGGHAGGTGTDVTAIQQLVVQACGFLPTASTVAALLGYGSLVQIAQEICAAVTVATPPVGVAASAKKRVPTLHGVPIRGQFVR